MRIRSVQFLQKNAIKSEFRQRTKFSISETKTDVAQCLKCNTHHYNQLNTETAGVFVVSK